MNLRKGSVVKSVVRLLAEFYRQQRGPEVRTMMAVLYEPLLWRYLKVTTAEDSWVECL
jgi:Condensin II non structural maintenance of chromosomes subunit